MANTFTLYHYTPISPLREEYSDDGSTVILSINCGMKDGRVFDISLLGTDDTIVSIRVTTPLLNEDKLSNEDKNRITGLVEHMLAVLRLTYDVEADFVRTGNSYITMMSFVGGGQGPRLHIRGIGREINPGYKIKVHNIATVFCNTSKLKEIVRLAADSQHPTLPIQYRYLTLYKIFERDFKKNKRWQKKS
jgi:hypothetical protein